MPDSKVDEEGNVFAGDRRIRRADSALPDWHIPDASYRPVPIVWFTGALLWQLVGQVLLSLPMLWLGTAPLVHIAFALLLTGMIGYRCWERGMETASTGWRVATVIMLSTIAAFVALARLY